MGFLKGLLGRGSSDTDYDTLVQQSLEELRLNTEAHSATWHLDEADWDVDQDAGTIVFTLPDGIRATGPVQIIGSWNEDDHTWLWSWRNSSVLPALQTAAIRAREYGERKKVPELITPKLACSEQDAWRLTAVACKLSSAQGAYRGPASPAFVFMTFGTIRLAR